MLLCLGLPDARLMFVTQNISQQAKKYMDMIGFLIGIFHELGRDMLIQRLELLGKDHIERGVKPQYFPVMLDTLHDTLRYV